MGIASGTNSSLREIGGVFGVAILASVFGSSDVYGSARTFVDHFTDALWVGAAFSAVGDPRRRCAPQAHQFLARKPHQYKEKAVTLTDKTVLVTGANRGIGQALVTEALSRGAKRVYAGTRQPFTHPDERVVPLILDVTDDAQIQAAVEAVQSLDILVNNAGLARL